MIELRKVETEEFTKTIYPEYEKIFPKEEKKSYTTIIKAMQRNVLDAIEIIDNKEFVGFIIMAYTKNSKYIILDYLAILPKYQNKGYGTNAVKKLKELYKSYKGIYIEIEKVGIAKEQQENRIRESRAKFYERTGAKKLNLEVNLFNVLYSLYIISYHENMYIDEEEIKQEVENIYEEMMGKERKEKNCKFII